MTNLEKNAIISGLNALGNTEKIKNLNNKEFKLYHYMVKCVETNVLPSEKDTRIFLKLIKKALR